jgi:quercetin dioxygenase-like cupin family protein
MKPSVSQITVRSASPEWQKSERLKSDIYQFPLPFGPEQEQIKKSYYILNGFSPEMQNLSCHVSALITGECPHPPHKHDQEEILILLAGEAELLLPENEKVKKVRIKAGSFVYYPAEFTHSLRAISIEPANYLVFRWKGRSWKDAEHLPYQMHDFSSFVEHQHKNQGFKTSLIFEGPTGYLRKLHCHFSVLAPGAGYDAHKDNYDVGIILLEGEVETLGESFGPYSVIYYRAGHPHGMKNPGNKIAKYIVFEFHSRYSIRFAVLRDLLEKIRSLKILKRKIRYWGKFG